MADIPESTKMDAVDILKTYAEFIRNDVRADDFERHPYLPHIEQTIEDLRAAPPAPIAEGVTCVAKPLTDDERKAAIDKWIAPPAMDREAVETAIRIGVWNACADRGMSQETATAIVQAVVAQPIVTKALSTLSADAIRQGEGGDRYANDAAAKVLYDSWSDRPGWVPWAERGNSDMQERARREVAL